MNTWQAAMQYFETDNKRQWTREGFLEQFRMMPNKEILWKPQALVVIQRNGVYYKYLFLWLLIIRIKVVGFPIMSSGFPQENG